MTVAAPPYPHACLVVLDGWGLAPPGPGNAVSLARTPVFDRIWKDCPHTTLRAGGAAVGLPEGQMGNSEVGHLNLGAGAVMRQDLVRIDDAIAAGELSANGVIRDALAGRPRTHLIGLVSDGGVHSSIEHLEALIDLAAQLGTAELFIHCFTDGRDTPPRSGAAHVQRVEQRCRSAADGRFRVASVVGRYFAMDRDRRWERTQAAYDLLVHGRGAHAAMSGETAVLAAYERDETDEFITATTVEGAGDGRILAADSVLAFNFRPDRMRQITRALADPRFGEREELPGWRGRGGAPAVRSYATLAQYDEDWSYPVAFPPERPRATLAQVLAQAGARQLHVAETEKYAHVTYFFNGGEEHPYAGEERALVDSPREVPTYDHKPQMSARAAAEAFVAGWRSGPPRFGIINFANPDMVGHTGVIPAAVAAVETVDACLGDVLAAVLDSGGACLVTADHGNAEQMLEPDGSPNTAHSLNPVPLILVTPGDGGQARQADGRSGEGAQRTDAAERLRLRDGGVLADVAPTVLALLGLEQPAAMTGSSLLARP